MYCDLWHRQIFHLISAQTCEKQMRKSWQCRKRYSKNTCEYKHVNLSDHLILFKGCFDFFKKKILFLNMLHFRSKNTQSVKLR